MYMCEQICMIIKKIMVFCECLTVLVVDWRPGITYLHESNVVCYVKHIHIEIYMI